MTILNELNEVVINGSENGFEFYAAGYRFFFDLREQVVYVEGTTCSEEIHLRELADRAEDEDEEYVELFLAVMEAVRECVRVREPAFVVMHYMTTDAGLEVSYHVVVVHDVVGLVNVRGCRIVATVYPRVLS